MAEPATTTTKKSATDDDASPAGDAAATEAASTDRAQTPLQIGLRVAIGFGGLALLVGFFLPWFREAGEAGAAAVEHSGLTLATSSNGDLVGTPAPLLFVVPVLGIALTAVAFMGFRFSAQVAVGAAVGLIGYSLYVLLQMFVQHTALGLWIVAASVFVVLALGVTSWMTSREPRKKDEPSDIDSPAAEP